MSFSEEQYRRINGFPNTFWGWGGEDDEMFKRVIACGYKPINPISAGENANADAGAGADIGTFLDMEQNTLEEKIQFLRERATLKVCVCVCVCV